MPEETEELVSQIQYSPTFIGALLEKLKVGNRRGIHLNALPGKYVSRLDLANLDILPGNKPEDFLQTLTSQEEFEFCIDFEGIDLSKLKEPEKKALHLLARRLDNMVYEVRDQFLEFGIENFGFGYPILIKRDKADPTKVIKAPLLVWSLDIEKSPRKTNQWFIRRKVEAPTVINELLRSHVLHDAQISLNALNEGVLEDGLVDRAEIASVCEGILGQINIGTHAAINTGDVNIERCPGTSKEIDSLATDDAWIQWSGVLGIYRSRKESIIARNEELLTEVKNLNEDPIKLERFRTSTVTSVDTDPSKEELINSLTNTEVKTIQGPPGTGKSQALTAIITNVVQNGGRCLIVCEKKTALDVIYENLGDIGLQDLCTVIDDVNRDRSEIIRAARSRFATAGRSYNETLFNTKYSLYRHLREEINARHKDVLSEVFDNVTWKDAIGTYLRYAKRKDFTIVRNAIAHDWLQYSHEELELLKSRAIEGEALFALLPLGEEGLFKFIPDTIFESLYTNGAREKIVKAFADMRDAGQTLNEIVTTTSEKETVTEGISIFAGEEVEKALAEVEKTIEEGLKAREVLNKLSESKKLVAQPRVLSVRFGERALALVHSESKRQVEIKKELIRHLATLKQVNDAATLLPLEPWALNHLAVQAGEISERLNALLDTQEKRLKKVKKLIALRDKILKAENHFINSIDPSIAIKPANLLKEKNWTEYSKKIQRVFEDVEELGKALPGYNAHHNWRHFLHRISSNERALINELVKLNLTEWADIVSAWYFFNVLSKHEGNRIASIDDQQIKQLADLDVWLKAEQPKFIKHLWMEKAVEAKRSFELYLKRTFNLLYNLRRNRVADRTNSLRKIIETDFDLFTSIFPILLVNPIVADSILPLKPGIFEVVMFDEASQLRIEDTFTSFIRGQFKIVAGDRHQMPPSNFFQSDGVLGERQASEDDGEGESEIEMSDATELASSESLLDYVEGLSFTNPSYLDYHYRSKHPALIEFSNQAFYGGNLVPFPASEDYVPIELYQVDGIWAEGVNEKEAEKVLGILQAITPLKSGKYPSVGIATFNITQRNFINDQISALTVSDKDFAAKMEAMREAGFFVKNLENIQGDEKDIIIISTTYGKTPEGKFFERFGPVNQSKGYQLLNVIVTRAKLKVYVCTSIPKAKYEAYNEHLERDGNHKKAALYAYLAYASAISERDNGRVEAILNELHTRTIDTPRGSDYLDLIESPFEQEVFELLSEKISADHILPQYKIGGFRIDFVVDIPGKKKLAIECDGKAYHSSNEAYAYDSFRETELRNMGFDVYRIWSSNWWHDAEREVKNLASYIENKLSS